ncbi:MAG TPA: AMP-binding protein, partial [Acidimicrobiales bacterium]|nr:AMP-binding protein [Acidimicrobiales bacterium]
MNLLDRLREGEDRPAVTMSDGSLTYRELREASSHLLEQVSREQSVALWATSELATVVGLCAALACGTPVVPLNPKSSERELEHVMRDARPSAIVASADSALPEVLRTPTLRRIVPDCTARAGSTWPNSPPSESTALIMYTSGTTGPPKGVVLSEAAVRANLVALASVWSWSERDRLIHALPLFHVHGLILGILGPLFVGASVHHFDSFSVERLSDALLAGGTMLFGVPTMYHRLANALGDDPRVATSLSRARLLVSGSGPLFTSDFERIELATGQRVVERYGMTETLIISSADPRGSVRPGFVGTALPTMELRVIDEDDVEVPADEQTIGSVQVRGASLFDGYLNQPQATADSFRVGWFTTGDLGVMSRDGNLRLVGRASTDLVKSGGYRIGTGEIEEVLLEHPDVDEVAVTGRPDPDLGQRIVAWIVPAAGSAPEEDALIAFVSERLSAHKRPREIVFLDELPRNAMGKIQKK